MAHATLMDQPPDRLAWIIKFGTEPILVPTHDRGIWQLETLDRKPIATLICEWSTARAILMAIMRDVNLTKDQHN